MRGLGIGIVVTALIMHFALGGEKETMTDEEIKARAAQLGMVESTLLSELAQNNDASVSGNEVVSGNETVSENTVAQGNEPDGESETVPESETASENEGAETVPENEEEAEVTPEPETVPEDEVENDEDVVPETETVPETEGVPENTTPDGSTVSSASEGTYITVYGGDGSDTVARRLAEAGVVSSATEYDAYLCANGFDVRICTGEHFIPAGATYEEIADILTSRQ